MAKIDQMSLIIQGLLVAGTALRIIIILIKISLNSDDKPQLIPKIKNALVFMVFGIIIFQIKDLIVGITLRRSKQMNDKHLYIPYGLIIEKQWWDGCGPKQKPQFVIGGLISLGLATVIFLLVHVIIGLAVGIFGILATVALVSKQDKTNLSMIDYIGLMIRKNKEQQNFLYKYKDDYGIM